MTDANTKLNFPKFDFKKTADEILARITKQLYLEDQELKNAKRIPTTEEFAQMIEDDYDCQIAWLLRPPRTPSQDLDSDF